MMKAISPVILFAVLATALVLPLAENSVFAQAPTGPQGGAPPPPQQQQNPAQPQAPTTAQQPPQAGVTIAVDVPIVTLDVVATTQHHGPPPGVQQPRLRWFFCVCRKVLVHRAFPQFAAERLDRTRDLRYEDAHRSGLHAEQRRSHGGALSSLFPGIQRIEPVRRHTGNRGPLEGCKGQKVHRRAIQRRGHLLQTHARSDHEAAPPERRHYFLYRFGPGLSELRRYERWNGRHSSHELSAGGKSAENFFAGDRRLFLVSSVRGRDAGRVSRCRRVPSPPVQPLLLANGRRERRQISQG